MFQWNVSNAADYRGDFDIIFTLHRMLDIGPGARNKKEWNYNHPLMGCYRLRDTKSGEMSYEVTGRAQSAICVFCRKQVAAWGKMTPSKRHVNKRWSIQAPEILQELKSTYYNDNKKKKCAKPHVPQCAMDWLRVLLCRWSTEMATPDECTVIGEWRHAYLNPKTLDDSDHWHRYPRFWIGLFDDLPTPINHEKTLCVEAMLLGLAKIYG